MFEVDTKDSSNQFPGGLGQQTITYLHVESTLIVSCFSVT